MTKALQDRLWKAFALNKLFTINSTSSGIDKCKLINIDGPIPYITRTDKNNGYELFVGKQQDKYTMDDANVITIGLDTQTVFYQSARFYTGQNIQVLHSDNLDKYVALFMIPMIKVLMQKFNWGGNGATLTRLRRSKILLPIDNNGNPDYNFMREYIKEREEKQRLQYTKHATRLIKEVSEPVAQDHEWREFIIKDLVELSPKTGKIQVPTGANVKKQLLLFGTTPRITVTSYNNGVDGFYSSDPKHLREYENFISMSFLGGAFYHPYKASTDMKVHTIKLKDIKLNRYIALFIITALRNNTKGVSYGDQLSSTDLPLKRILLPVDKNMMPDYRYMENYMKKLEYKKISAYLESKKLI